MYDIDLINNGQSNNPVIVSANILQSGKNLALLSLSSQSPTARRQNER